MFKSCFKKSKIQEKDAIVLKNVLGSFGVKGLSLFISLAVMPTYMKFFNNASALGLWFTIISVLNWILNFDIGIGNGLRNRLVESLAEKDNIKSQKYISAAYCSIGIISVGIMLLFFFVYRFVNWNAVLNVEKNIITEKTLQLCIIIVFLSIVGQFFFGLITSILYALQLAYVNNIISLVRSVLLVVVLNIIPRFDDNNKNLMVMSLANLLITLLPLILVTIIIFNTKLKNNKPRLSFFNFTFVKRILSLGVQFLFAQILYTIIMTNEYFITLFSSNDYVVDYQIYNKPFSMISMVFTLAITPIWSAITKAYTENDFLWIKKLFKKLIFVSSAITIIEFITIPFMQIFFDLWLLDNSIKLNVFYAISFAILFGLMNLNSVFSSIVNGIGKIHVQITCFTIGAIAKIPLSFLLVKFLDSWIGVVWANIFCLSLYCIIQPFYLKGTIKKGDQ